MVNLIIYFSGMGIYLPVSLCLAEIPFLEWSNPENDIPTFIASAHSSPQCTNRTRFHAGVGRRTADGGGGDGNRQKHGTRTKQHSSSSASSTSSSPPSFDVPFPPFLPSTKKCPPPLFFGRACVFFSGRITCVVTYCTHMRKSACHLPIPLFFACEFAI